MSAKPWETMFIPEKIVHKSVKERKDFVMDCVFIGTAVSLLYAAIHENFTDESDIRTLHKNKDRKSISKIKENWEYLYQKQRVVYDKLTKSDLNTIKHKVNSGSVAFIEEISMSDKTINLEYTALCILKYGLERKSRRTPISEILEVFNIKHLTYNNIGITLSRAGIKISDEKEIAQNFVNRVRY